MTAAAAAPTPLATMTNKYHQILNAEPASVDTSFSLV